MRKWALLIGIDQYPLLPGRNLLGCVNDAQLWRQVLVTRFAFPAEQVTLLTDAAATRAGILGAWDALIARVEANDIVVFVYAGHGSRRANAARPDGMMNTLVPSDSGRDPGQNRDISDSEVNQRLARLGDRTRYTTLIFDCCHSQTAHRDVQVSMGRAAPEDPGATAVPDERPRLPPTDRFASIAACRDAETAQEHRIVEDGALVHHGALTFFLTREILGPLSEGASLREIVERAAARLGLHYPTQHPCCEGAVFRTLFGLATLPPPPVIKVIAATKTQLTISAGVLHGVRSGSRFGLDAADAAPGSPAVACEIEVTNTGTTRSTARALGPGDPPKAGARLVERSRPMSDRLSLAMIPDAAPIIAAQLTGSPWLRLCAGGATEAPDLIVRHLSPAAQSPAAQSPAHGSAADSAWDLGPLAGPIWLAIGKDGMPRWRLPADRPDDPEQTALITCLQAYARYVHALHLDPPKGRLSSSFSVALLRQAGDTGPFLPVPAGTEAIFDEGDAISIHIHSRHNAPIFVTVLDLGIDHSVSQLFPPPGSPGQRVNPGAKLVIGEGELRLYFPRTPSLQIDKGGGWPTQGREHLKIFVTGSEVDLSLLLVPGRNIALSQPIDEQWATVTREILLRRSIVAPSDEP